MKMEEKEIAMEVVNPQAAGVDIGSRSHWAAIGQKDEDVQEFDVLMKTLKEWHYGLRKRISRR